MKDRGFQFKEFTIYHNLCAMKVGTDGVLLGAWTEVGDGVEKILDIGTGSGLMAIMLAQKSNAYILGIDIDKDAVVQAQTNAELTKWSERLNFICEDVRTFETDEAYDLIVCNPPFFENSLQGPDTKRNLARHTASLPFVDLVNVSYKVLKDNGMLNVILPFSVMDDFIQIAWERGLNLLRKCLVFTKVGSQPKRVMMCFKKGSAMYPETEKICIKNIEGEYTPEYIKLTKDFYLDF